MCSSFAKNMKSKPQAVCRKYLLVVFGFAIALVLITWAFFSFQPAKSRVMRDHGLTLPASAKSLEFSGDAWKRSFIDCGAVTAFEIPISELPSFLASLSISGTSPGSRVVPSNRQYALSTSWASRASDTSYSCRSTTGDFLSVGTWKLSESQVGVVLYTDWN
jgi:hypothetical protein